MALDEITLRLAKALGDNSGLGRTMKLDFGPAGVIHIDAANHPNRVSNDNNAADCVVHISMDNFILLAKGKLNPAIAMLQKKMRVEGDASVAMQLGALLQANR